MSPDEAPRRVPLHPVHERLGARFVTFSGHDMPVLYSSIQEEHARVRQAAGLFDVSHMGNLRIEGKGAAALLSSVTVADITALPEGKGIYTVLPDDNGHIIDDTIIYRTAPEDYYMVPNAGMHERIAEILERRARRIEDDVVLQDVTRSTCILALQGPKAPDVLQAAGAEVAAEPRFRVHEAELHGAPLIATTTGYTGETGYELFVHNDHAKNVFEALLEAGTSHGLVPAGLGARDTLRIEMAYALAGHEFQGGRTPLEAKLAWTIHWDHDFVGREALLALKEEGGYDRLVGLEMTGRGIPREGHRVLDPAGKRIGIVTSGTQSPTLGKAIGLAYVAPDHAKPGTTVAVEVRGKAIEARVVKTPFLKR